MKMIPSNVKLHSVSWSDFMIPEYEKDVIYGLLGLMSITRGGEFLYPNYHKSTAEVYSNSVATVLTDMQNPGVLHYAPGTDHPPCVSRWDRPISFRNLF